VLLLLLKGVSATLVLLVFSYLLTSRRYSHRRFLIGLFADNSLAFLFVYTHFAVDEFLLCLFLALQIAQIVIGKVFDCLLCLVQTVQLELRSKYYFHLFLN